MVQPNGDRFDRVSIPNFQVSARWKKAPGGTDRQPSATASTAATTKLEFSWWPNSAEAKVAAIAMVTVTAIESPLSAAAAALSGVSPHSLSEPLPWLR